MLDARRALQLDVRRRALELDNGVGLRRANNGGVAGSR